jgi:hypothetical protein
MRHHVITLVLVLVLAAVGSASAADYYVNTSGDDRAVGTQAKPWRTVGKVNGRTLVPGDRVFFAGGQTFTDAGLKFAVGDAGNAGNRVVVDARLRTLQRRRHHHPGPRLQGIGADHE